MIRKRLRGRETSEEKPSRLRMLALIAAALAVLWPYAVSLGDQPATFRLINSTGQYLHVKINSDSHVYIAPGMSVGYESHGNGDIVATATYSPGQGSRGTVTRTFKVTVTTTNTNSQSSANDCSSHSNQPNDCFSTQNSNITN